MLIDNHGRPITYLRLAVTDRCNLRCRYCMPAEGLQWLPGSELLTADEILRIMRIFSSLGITKIRFTGGEPFLRKDLMSIIRQMVQEDLFQEWSVTTNGTLCQPWLAELKELGIHSVNLSVDSLNPERFEAISLRNSYLAVRQTFDSLLDLGIHTRLNAVIMDGINEEDVQELSELILSYPIDVRFIEEMPFNGRGDRHAIRWNWKNIEERLTSLYPGIEKQSERPGSTSLDYHVPGSLGTLGIIAAWSRTFCGTCNRVRLTPKGIIKTCLYDAGVMDLKTLIRNGASDEVLRDAIADAMKHRAKDGFEAESRKRQLPVSESMATIGG